MDTCDTSNVNSQSPYKLKSMLQSKTKNNGSFNHCALFPWNPDSVDTLFPPVGLSEDEKVVWRPMLAQWADCLLMAGTEVEDGKTYPALRIVSSSMRGDCPPISHQVSMENGRVSAVGWALLSSKEPTPLVLMAVDRVVYLFNPVSRSNEGWLRGHGQLITSIAVHPHHPQTFATTSHDHSTRLYDLGLPPRQGALGNPHWLPSTQPSFGGAAHGLQATEIEGFGKYGRCIAVFVGGRPGGHNAAVLGVAFNPYYPTIATCGMDRHIKIWKMPSPAKGEGMRRECRPIFSTSKIHKARVISVSWKTKDTLVTHSAPCILRHLEGSPKKDGLDYKTKLDYEYEEGTLAIWQWTGANRFFPPGHEPWSQENVRGVASDYEESASFTVFTRLRVPSHPLLKPGTDKKIKHPKLTDYRPLFLTTYNIPGVDADPLKSLGLYIRENKVHIINLDYLERAHPPPFPLPYKPKRPKDAPMFIDSDDEREEEARYEKMELVVEEATPLSVIPPGWTLSRPDDLCWRMEACAMGFHASTVIAVGQDGNLAVWKASST